MSEEHSSTTSSSSTRSTSQSSTHWSVVMAAGSESEEARAAFEKLYKTYSRPLLRFLRGRGLSKPDSEDVLQSFFAYLYENDVLRRLTGRERFRSWLFTSVKNYSISEWRKRGAKKRGENQVHVPIGSAHEDGEIDPSDTSAVGQSSKEFDRDWALTLLEEVLTTLKAEYEKKGKARHFAELQPFLAGSKEGDSYDVIGKRLGITKANVAVMVRRMRQQFSSLFHAEVAKTVSDAEIEDEVKYLSGALAAG